MPDIDLDRLSPTSRAVKILIGDQLPEGYNESELAARLGRTPSWVSEKLQQLREELLLQSGHFFPLSEHEYAALRAGIEANGIQVPIIVGEHLPLIDGRHRCQIARELGISEVSAMFVKGMSPDQERELAVELNASRRQLTRQQKQTLVDSELMHDRNRSNARISRICGVSTDFVDGRRSAIVSAETYRPSDAEIARAMPPAAEPAGEGQRPLPPPPVVPPPVQDWRVSSDNRVMPGYAPRGPKAEAKELGSVICPHCTTTISISQHIKSGELRVR